MPAHELKLLSLTDVFVESSFLVLGHNMGTPIWVHTWGILILRNPAGPILVDTGARDPEIMGRLGMQGRVDEDMQLENALGAHGVSIGDVAAVLHTHCHIDHAGQDERFPMTTPVVMNRRELERTASICGDVIYDIQNQIVEPWHQVLAFEPQTTGNHTLTKRDEKAAIKKALNSGTFVLPIHDFPARVDHGRVVARLKDEVPGPEWPVEEFAAEFAEP